MVMAAFGLIGKIDPFDETIEPWESYVERFVCGIRHPHIQKRLLSEKDLTFEKAMEINVAMEAAAKDATELVQARNRTDTGAVNRLYVKNRRSRGNDRKN